jgi:tetratricopeptide (TPR) repeat protein
MHMTQSRFIRYFRDHQHLPSLWDRKPFGDSFLVHVPTSIHADFSSLGMLDLPNPVPGYWGARSTDSKSLHEAICRNALTFFDGYLKGNAQARISLQEAAGRADASDGGANSKIEMKKGRTPPASGDELINLMIEKGFRETKPAVDQALVEASGEALFDETVLNWLGYHFLTWWGRDAEAVEVFELNTRLFPQSANAFDSLGEAYRALGKLEQSIACYEKSLVLNPGNKDVQALIQQLKTEAKEIKK